MIGRSFLTLFQGLRLFQALALWGLVASLSPGMLSGAPSYVGGATEPEPLVDRRSHELVRLDCASGILSRELSLFANGTVRIRDRGGPDPGIRLAEFNENELDGFRARLEEIDLSEASSRIRGPSGETLEQCLLRLEMTSGQIDEFRFPRLAALPLSLGRLLAVLDDLTLLAEQRYRLSAGLPISYQPRAGDLLVKSDGSRYRIVRVTAEGAGVEIIALESPLVLYLSKDGVRGEFVAIESRRRSVTGGR